MKFSRYVLVFSSVAANSNSVFAAVALGVDANYVSSTNHQTDTSGKLTDSVGTGYGIIPSLRYEFTALPLLTIGIGAYATFGAVYPTLTSGATSDTLTGLGYGGDFWLVLTPGLPIKPFARFMIGGVSLEEKVTIPTTAGTYNVTVGANALQFNILAGIRLPLMPLLELYVQGGYSGVGTQTPALKNATLNGTPTSAVTVATSSAYATGYLLGAGVMLSF